MPSNIAKTGKLTEQFPGTKLVPLEPKHGIEVVPGKKYLVVIKTKNAPRAEVEVLCNSAPILQEYFLQRGIDLTFMVADQELEVYELDAKG